MTTVLLTGATGHAGSHIVEHILQHPGWEVVSLQRLPGPDMLAHLSHMSRIRKVYHDLRAPLTDRVLKEIGPVDYIIHNGAVVPNAATTSSDPDLFIQSNTVGTFHMLEAARRLGPNKFIYTSTGQVLGPCVVAKKEDARLDPPHVYAASKAAGELLANSYYKSFGVPVITTRVMNLFGQRQQRTKFIMGAFSRILLGQPVTLHVDIAGRPANIQWLHAASYAEYLIKLLMLGKDGEIYHVPGAIRSTEDVVKQISVIVGEPVKIERQARPYLEQYQLDGSKLAAFGLHTFENFEQKLEQTLLWTAKHQEWL